MTRTNRRWIRGALAAFGLALGAAAPASAQEQSVKFMDIPGPGNMLIRVAIAKGYCQKHGIKCELQVIPAAPLGVQAMLAKSIDSAIAPADVIIGAIKNGAKVKMVTGSLVSNLLQLVVATDMAQPNAGKPWPAFMADFKGKRIGVTARGASTETAMRFLMTKAGMNADDATYVAVGGAITTYNALASRQIDVAMIVEPTGSICQSTKVCKVVWRGSEDAEPSELFKLNGSSNGLVFTQESIDRRPEVIAAVIKAVTEADAFINTPANFEEVVTIANRYFKFELPGGDDIMRTNLAQFIKNRTYSARIDRASIKGTIDYLLAAKLIDAPIDASQLVYELAP